MVLNNRLSGWVTLAILAGLIGVGVTSTNVARAAAGKRVPPANIVSGSTVTKGRVFYDTGVPENSLAGVRLGAKAIAVLSAWGNPTRITLSGGQSTQPAAPAAGGAPGAPMMGAPGMMGPGAGPMPGAPGMMGPGAGPMPGAPGMMGPGMGPMAGGPGMMGPGAGAGMQAPAAGGTSSSLSSTEVVWTYDLPTGLSLEFVISENVVTQITVGGLGPWGLSKTKLGLQLGDTYKLVIWAAGYPESQEFSGRFLRMSYVNKYRALYTLDKNKVVGVTIALDPDNVH